MTENYTDGLIFSKNIDDKGTPFTPKLVEVGVVSENGKVQCKQNVYKKNGITLISPIGLRKVSKPELLVDTNNAYFIYEDRGEVLFSEDLIGQVVVFEYYGTGNPNIGDCRVFTTVDNNGNITETLNGLLKENRKELDAIMKIGGGIVLLNKLDEVVKNAEILNIALGVKIVTGTALDLTLKETIRVGNETDKKVRDTIKVANDTDAKLNSTIATGTILDNSLKSNITKGTEVDNKLKATIVEGEKTDTKLNNTINSATEITNYISESENRNFTIDPSDWTLNNTTKMYEKTWTHNMNRTSLIFEYMTLKNGKKCGYFMDYEIQDNNTVKFITETNGTVFVVVTGRYFTGLEADESLLEVDKMADGAKKVVMTRDERELLKTHSSDLADIEQQTDGRKVKFIAFAIRNNGSGFQLINDTLHTPLNALTVENGVFDVTVNYKNSGLKVISLIVAPDETMAIEGVNVGASVGIDKATIKFSKQDDVFGYLTKSGGDASVWTLTDNSSYGVDNAVWEIGNKRLKITHKKCFNSMPTIMTRNPEIIAYPKAINGRGGFTTTYISFKENKCLNSIIRFQSGAWTTSDMVGVSSLSWDSVNSRLTINHLKINNLCVNLTPRVKGIQILPYVVGNDYVTLEFYKDGIKLTSESTDMNFILNKQSDSNIDVIPDDNVVLCFSYSGKYLIPTSDLTFTNSNFWCIGMIEV